MDIGNMNLVEWISALTLALAAIVLLLIAGVIIKMMYCGTSDGRVLNFLYENPADGQSAKPSVSRLQMLIWNFVVAFAFLYVLGARGGNVGNAIKDLFQPEVLILLGISNGTYLLGKRTRQGTGGVVAGSAPAPAGAGGSAGQPDGDERPAAGPGPQGTQ